MNFRHLDVHFTALKVFLCEISLFIVNLLGGVLVTRSVTLNEKSLLVIISTIPSLYIALFVAKKVEYILRGVSKENHYKSREIDIFLLPICVFLISLNFKYPVYFLAIPLLISYFSSRNAISLARTYVERGRFRYSALRLFHVSIIQIGNLLYVLFLHDFSIMIIPFFYLLAELVLLLAIRNDTSSISEITPKPIRTSKYASFLSYFATTIGANYYLFLIVVVSIVVSGDWLAYISVALSIVSPFQVLSAFLIPAVLSNRSNIFRANVRWRNILAASTVAIIIYLIMRFSAFESRIVHTIFGESYQYLTYNTHLLLIGGLLTTAARIIDSFLRREYHYLYSAFVNLFSFFLFICMILTSKPSIDLNQNVFAVFTIHFGMITVIFAFLRAREVQLGKIKVGGSQ
jgi:hypothetical protein